MEIHFRRGPEGEFPNAPRPQSGAFPDTSIDDNWSVSLYSASSLAELKKLLSRFPEKTTFGFPTGMLTDAMAEQKLFDELQKQLASNNQQLVKLPLRE